MSEGSELSFKILTEGDVISSYCPSFTLHTKATKKINDIMKLAPMNMKKLLITSNLHHKFMPSYLPYL